MRRLVIAGSERTLTWKGVALTEGEYDVLREAPRRCRRSLRPEKVVRDTKRLSY
jgi:hypothetical protein